MKRFTLLLILLAGSALAASVTRTYNQSGRMQTTVMTGTTASDMMWTNRGFVAVSPSTVVFTFDSSVTTTLTVELRRGGVDNLLGTTTGTGTTFVFDLGDEEHPLYAGEVLVLNTGSAINCNVSLNVKTVPYR
jgi:hypothetical protein